MRAFFHPFLPNGLAGDPLLWVDLLDEGEAVLLDLGDTHAVAPRKLLRVRRVVVSHAHVDHFIGFDRLLRVVLRSDREITLTGPAGFVAQVRAKLDAYTWNLVEGYPVRFNVEEVEGHVIRSVRFDASSGFRAGARAERPFGGTVHEGERFRVDVEVLDHGTPVLGAALTEHERLAVDPASLARLGLKPGAWLNRLKRAVRAGDHGRSVEAETVEGTSRALGVAELAAAVLSRAPGQRLAYLTDFGFTPANVERAVHLAADARLLVCEAAFLHADLQLATERNHLTARQAGIIAREAGAKSLAVFHLSNRYDGREEELLDEAAQSFGGPLVRLPRGSAPREDSCG